VSGTSYISVLIAESDDRLLARLERWLAAQPTTEIVGSASDGDAAVGLARRTRPDVVLMDMSITGKPGVDATEMITTLLPATDVIIISQDGSADCLRRAMIAGARQFVVSDSSRAELLRAIRDVHQSATARRESQRRSADVLPHAVPRELAEDAAREGRIFAVFSPKGGVGKTTLAVNLAIALRCDQGLDVALVDGSLPFGDVSTYLGMVPSRSLSNLAVEPQQIDHALLDYALSTHPRSGVRVLFAPPRPEMAEKVTSGQLRRALALLKETFHYTIVDTWPSLDERVLAVLEMADKIVLCVTPDVIAIRHTKVFLEVNELARIAPQKFVPILIRSTGAREDHQRDVEAALGRPVAAQISHDAKLASRCLQEGTPLVLNCPGSGIAEELRKLAASLAGGPDVQPLEGQAKQRRAG
jgi:pilus assembly protein CpaE